MASQASARFAHVLINFPSRNGSQTLCSGAWKGRLPQGVAMATGGDGQAVMRRGLRSVPKTERSPAAVVRPRFMSHDFLGRGDQRNRRMLQESACVNSSETTLPCTPPDAEESNKAVPPYTEQDAIQGGGDGSGSTLPDGTREEVVECYQCDGHDGDCFVIDDWSKYELAASTLEGGTTVVDPNKVPYNPRRHRLTRPQATLQKVEECYQEDGRTDCFEIADPSTIDILGDAPSTSALQPREGGTTTGDPKKTPYNPRKFRYRR